MIEIDLAAVFSVVGFVATWLVFYLVSVLLRFGSDLKWWTELIALIISAVPPVLIFTDLVVFV